LDTVIIDLPGNLAHPQSQLDGLPVTLTAATARGAPALANFCQGWLISKS
jgi:hypothetical protein